MAVGFDFDRVLFEPKKLKKKLQEEFPEFEKTYGEFRDRVYHFREHCESMGVDPDRFLDRVEELSKGCLYPDVEKVQELDREVVIVTRGEPMLQQAKIEGSGAMEYFDSYIIVEDMSKDIWEIEALVDDLEEELVDFSGVKVLFDRESMDLSDAVEMLKEKL